MRVEGDFIKINDWLLPLSWLYGLGVDFRNWMFDVGLLKSHDFSLPVISVGNITVGGSGKTPHVEYLIQLLKDKVKVAVLSRGYKRKSRGYVLANANTSMQDIGDEPWQMHRKFPGIHVAVDKHRVEGIERLTHDAETSDTDVVLLDDAFQHRYVKPGINILLVDYHRLIIYDKLLPAGRLRESEKGKRRADMVIITKCPHDLKPMEFRVLTKALNLYPYQELYFTTLDYAPLRKIGTQPEDIYNKVYAGSEKADDLNIPPNANILLLTGIASPKQMIFDLTPRTKLITPMTFADHHSFSEHDIQRINETFAAMPEPKMIITTEKDESRLLAVDGLSAEVKDHLFVLPVRIRFMLDQEESFNHKILSYVHKNSRNSILVKRKDDHKSADSHHPGNRPRTISFRDN